MPLSTMVDFSDSELDELYAFAVQLGKDAGDLLMQAAQRRISGGSTDAPVHKESSVDIVTETDNGKCSAMHHSVQIVF